MNEFESSIRVLYLLIFFSFISTVIFYLLIIGRGFVSQNHTNIYRLLWPATVLPFFAALIFRTAIELSFEEGWLLSFSNFIYISSVASLALTIVWIAGRKLQNYLFFLLLVLGLFLVSFEWARRIYEIQLRQSILALSVAIIFYSAFLKTTHAFWKKSITANLKFISIATLSSAFIWTLFGLITLFAYLNPIWLPIAESLYQKGGIRIFVISLHIFLLLLIATYFYEVNISFKNKKIIDIEKQMLDTLNSLALARDNETGNHIIRTQKYVVKIASRLSMLEHYSYILSKEYISLLRKAAPLHDIGKVGIPDYILLKPDKLTDPEWQIMKTHTSIGENVLASAQSSETTSPHEVLAIAIEIAGAHHEKFDGSGYPRGLKGTSIPLSARIMALADMYDALVSERVYKKSWTHEDAVQEIVSRSGTHFDHEIVEAFIVEQYSIREIADQYRDE